MKRIFTVLAVLSVWTGAWAQDTGYYEATFTVRIRDGVDNHSGRCTNKFEMFTTLTGEAETKFWPQDLNPIGTTYLTFTKKMTIPLDKKLTSVRFYGERNWRNTFGCNGNGDMGGYLYPSYTTCLSSPSYATRIPNWDSRLTIKIVPKVVNVFYFNRANQHVTDPAQFYLPESHRIQIKATQGYPAATYQWQYKVGSGGWQSFSSSLYSGNTLTFAGNDIVANFRNVVALAPDPTVRVRFTYGCGGYSNEIVLRGLPSAPDYTNVEGIAPSCSYLTDGKIKVTLDRALDDGETVSFTVGGVPYAIENLTRDQFESDHSYTMDGFPSFNNRQVSFVGFYKGVNTYTDDPASQNRLVSIPVRTPVTFNVNPFAAHCFGGADGRIQVTAGGGNQQYTAYLDQAGSNLRQINFSEADGGVFSDLEKGTYTVRLVDSRACEPRDGSGAAITYSPEVAQPAQRVLVTALENEYAEPLGYGHTDGYITVRSESGTNPYTFEWTDLNSNATLTPEPAQTEGSSMKSRLSGIGKGRYHVIARDAQYALASPQTEQNISGCYDTLSFVMDEPPLLTVSLDEYHFVSCHAYTDGEVVAHAEGGRPYLAGHPREPYLYEWFVVDGSTLTPFGGFDSLVAERPSAWYRVKVTDRNGIIAWSEDYHLVQPDPLTISFKTSQLLCNGDTNGTSEATPAGGTEPYRYAWSTEEGTAAIANLRDGWYSVVVTDTRGCTTFSQTEVVVPEGMAVEAATVPPLCEGYADGSIALTVTGGKKNYTYAWAHGPDTDALTDLPHGTYSVRITDANGCFLLRDYTLENPALFAVDLGPDRVLCKDQDLQLNPAIDDPQAQYQWSKDNVPFAATPAVTLTDPGTYKLAVTDGKGCHNDDDVVITRTNTEIAASIVVATRVPVGGTFRVANISHPAPDSIQWLLPQEAKVVGKTGEYAELIFSTRGEYTVGMKSFAGSCEAVAYAPVRVVSASELTDYQTPAEPYIKQFMVSPNPTKGPFTATVQLREAGDFALILYNGNGVVLEQQNRVKQTFASVDFDMPPGTSPGIYVLQLITAQGYAIFKVVVE